ALAALAGSGRDEIEPWLDPLLADPDLAAIAAAASSLLGGDTEPSLHAVGSGRARASAILGRALASTEAPALRRAVAGFADAAPEANLARALTLELDVEDGAGGRIARAVSGWRDDNELERERGLAGAL